MKNARVCAKKIVDEKYEQFCSPDDQDAYVWILEGLPGVPYHMMPEYGSLYEANKNLRLFNQVFEAGISAGKHEVRKALGIN